MTHAEPDRGSEVITALSWMLVPSPIVTPTPASSRGSSSSLCFLMWKSPRTTAPNKHGMTPSSLAAFSAGVILAAIFANAVVFPRSYDALGPRAMLSVFCVVTAVSFGTAYASEDYPVL